MSQLKFLAFSDIMAKFDLIDYIVAADLSDYDFIMYLGDSPDPTIYKIFRKEGMSAGRPWSEFTTAAAVKHPEIKSAMMKAVDDTRRFNGQLATIKKKIPIIGILGNADSIPVYAAPLVGREPVQLSENIQILHNKVTEMKGFQFIGYNGRSLYLDEQKTKPDCPELYFADEKACNDLCTLFEQTIPEKTIFATHAPPYAILDKVYDDWIPYACATYGDKAKKGNIGCNAFRDVATKYQPLLHIFGHIHEARGTEKLNRTTFVNVGSLGDEEETAEILITNGQVKARWLKVREL